MEVEKNRSAGVADEPRTASGKRFGKPGMIETGETMAFGQKRFAGTGRAIKQNKTMGLGLDLEPEPSPTKLSSRQQRDLENG